MAVITATIGSGGGRTYSTVQLWEDALPADLVSDGNARVGECYNDGGAALARVSISAHTTNSTNYLKLTAAAGQSFMDNANVRTTALAFASGTYAALRTTTGYTFCVDLTGAVDYFTCDRLMLESTVGSAAPFTAVSGCDHNLWKDLICSSANTTTNVGEIYGNSTYLVNVAYYQNSGSGAPITFRNDPTLVGCTFIRTTNNGVTGTGPTARNYSTPKMQSCAVFGYTTVVGTVGAGAWGASSKNNATQASSGLPGSSNQHSVTFNATTPFTQASNSSTDLRAVASTSLDATGFLDSTNAPNDISGTARAATPTIGAWELSGGGGGASVGEASYLLPLAGRKAPPGWQLRGTVLDAAPVADPVFPPLSRVPGRAPTVPPDAYFWVEPAVAVVAPFLGQATQVPHGRPPVAPQVVGAAPIVLQGELPLPPTAPPVVPRRAPSTPLETYQWPGLSALDPHIGDYPVAPWTAAAGVPKAGTWRPVGVVESQVPPVAVVEPPPGQAHVGRGVPRAPEGGTWATFWNPPDVVAELPPGAAEGGVPPSRLPVRGLVELSVRVAQTLLGELPPGRTAQAGGRAGGRGPVAWDLPSMLLFAIVLPPPPAQSGIGGPPRSALRRGRTTIWSWSGYIPVPATPMPPGVQRGPFAGKGHGHAPVSPYLAAYVLSVPPATFGPAVLWQFPDGLTMYTFGGDEAAAWEFPVPATIWEW